ncbi:hypothetical protein BURMUCGD2M_6640 [Burkholderia multivorans CGD2M]|nr:hypothetical protein BURMUCGD2M_6640 [Burkholderia multivorans CGD2M]
MTNEAIEQPARRALPDRARVFGGLPFRWPQAAPVSSGERP